jgi:hypothetical protein
MTAFLSLEAAIWVVIVGSLGTFIYEQIGSPRLAAAGMAVDLFCISMLACTIRLIVAAGQIDYDQPIAVIQRQLEALRVLRIRITRWGLLAGTVVWAPFVLVVFKAFFGLDIFSTAWLVANLLFGLALIPLAYWVSKRFGNRMGQSPFLHRLMRDITGHNLAAAQGFLGELAQFEAEV